MWLSVIQLWHFLFIGTLNSLLTNLAGGDRALGMWWGWEAASCTSCWGLGTSRVRGAKISRAMCSNGRSESGFGEEGQAGQGQGGKALSCEEGLEMTLQAPSLSSAVSSYTNAFAITQFFGVVCAPWNGLLMDRLKEKYQKEARKTGETWLPRVREPGGERSSYSSMPSSLSFLIFFVLVSVHPSIHPPTHLPTSL